MAPIMCSACCCCWNGLNFDELCVCMNAQECICCEFESHCKLITPKTCCAGQFQCCCCVGGQGFPPSKESGVPCALASLGLQCYPKVGCCKPLPEGTKFGTAKVGPEGGAPPANEEMEDR